MVCEPESSEVNEVLAPTFPMAGSSGRPGERWLTTVPEKPSTSGFSTAAMSAAGVVAGSDALEDALEVKAPVAAYPATQAIPMGASHRSAGWRCRIGGTSTESRMGCSHCDRAEA